MAQSDPAIKNLKMESLVMKSGDVFKGILLEQNIRYVVFKIVEKKIDGPLRTFELTVEKKDVESIMRITPDEKVLLETQIKKLVNVPAPIPRIVKAPLPEALKNIELVPLIGNTEPPRLRRGGPSYFSISQNANRVFLGENSEKTYLKLRKATMVQGNDDTGRIVDATFYLGKLLTGTDSGNLATWGKHGILEKNYKAIDSPIRLIVPLQLDLLVFDNKWQFFRCDPETKTKISYEKVSQLPLKDVSQTSKFMVSKHGDNYLTVWNSNLEKLLYTIKIGEDFNYLVAPEQNYLAIVKYNEVDVYDPNTGEKIFGPFPRDPGSYCSFANVSIIFGGQLTQTYSMIIKQAGTTWYYDLKNNKKYRNVISQKLYKGDLVFAEIETVKELSVEPGVRVNGVAANASDSGFLMASDNKEIAYIAVPGTLGAVKISRNRPEVTYRHIHTPYLVPGDRLDMTSKFVVDNHLHCEIVPASTTLFLDEKIAYCSGDKYFHLLGGFRGDFKIERGSYFNISNVCLNNTGSKMAHSAHNSICYVWDTEKKTKSATIYGDDYPTKTMALSGNGKIFLTCHSSGNVIFWDVEDKSRELKRFVSQENLQKAFLSHDGSKLLLHSKSDRAYFLNASKVSSILPKIELENDIKSIPLDDHMNAKILVFKAYTWKPSWDPNIEENEQDLLQQKHPLFNPDNMKSNPNYGVSDNQDQFVSMNQEGTRGVSLLNKTTMACWDLLEGKQLFQLEHDDPITCVKISNDGKWILTGNEKMEVFVFDGQKGKKIYRFKDDYGAIYSLGFFQNEKYACLGSRYGVTFWDLEKGVKAYTLLRIGGVLFFDQNGCFDADHHSKNYIAFRNKTSMELFLPMREYGNSGGVLSPYENILKNKECPGMLKNFLKAENVEVFQN